MRSRLLVTLAILAAIALSGCSPKPSLSPDDIESVQFWSLQTNRKWAAPKDQVERFIAAYSEAERLSGDFGTTPPARIDVELKDGTLLTVAGGGETYQSVEFGEARFNIRSQELHFLLQEIAEGG